MASPSLSPQSSAPDALDFQEVVDFIRAHQNFLVIGHLRPDGDCLGSCLGMLAILNSMGKTGRFYTKGPVPPMFSYLPLFDTIETVLPDAANFDGVLCIDTADEGRVHPGYGATEPMAVIDHHISNTRFGSINWVDGTAAAAAEMVYHLALELDVEITAEIATALFTGIATDTGSFRFSNANATTFSIAADLVARGANPSGIAEIVWGSRSAGGVKLSAMVLSTIRYEFDGKFAWNEITRSMMVEAGADESEAEGLSGDIRAVEGVEVAVLFTEAADGTCRIGFRSRQQVNVSAMAALLGGGGHKSASGATLTGPYAEARDRALEIIRNNVQQQLTA